VHPLKAGWFHVLANPVLHGVSPAAMNRHEAFAAASMDGGAPCVVLVRPRVQANLGAVAQAMLNFGLSEMRLVDPFVDHLGPEAMERARGATQVLQRAKVYATVADATKGLALTMAATARLSRKGDAMGGSFGGFGLGPESPEANADASSSRSSADGTGTGMDGCSQCASAEEKAALASVLAKQSHSPRSCAEALRLVAARNQKSGFLLGPEGTGLTVADLVHATALVHVPTHPAFSSLNLAAALTILAYESWTARHGDRFAMAQDGSVVADLNIRDHPATATAAASAESEPSNGAAARDAARALTSSSSSS
jgi:tRNA C32,U32 (ribose-2'-O)-methylase TrmJ